MEPFLGQIMMVGFNFAPRGWAKCEGQLLSIAQNQALFSLLGTTYGGDGRTTFALPDLRGRFPMHEGTGPGLPNHPLGQKAGSPTAPIAVANLPAHNHATQVTNNLRIAAANAANSATPNDTFLAGSETYSTGPANTQLNAGAIAGDLTVATQNTGGNQPLNVQNPFLAVNFIIALVGLYPSRN